MGIKRNFTILCAIAVLGVTVANAGQEKIALSVAESNPEYRLGNLVLIPDDPTIAGDQAAITLDLKGANGENVSCRYGPNSTPTANTLLVGLNKANLSTAYAGNATTGSLIQRIFHRLVIMGESTAVCGKTLTGSLAGSVP